MAIDLTLKSTGIANREATPKVLNNPGTGGAARLKEIYGYLASVTAALSITSVIRMVEVPSNAYISDIQILNKAQGAGAVDIGVYRTPADGGAAVDADLFASGVSLAGDLGVVVVPVDLTNESTTFSLVLRQQRLWQAAGLTVDPKCMFDICLTVAATDVTTGTGAVALRVRYVE